MSVTRSALTAILGGLLAATPLAAQARDRLDFAGGRPMSTRTLRYERQRHDQGTRFGTMTRTDGTFDLVGIP